MATTLIDFLRDNWLPCLALGVSLFMAYKHIQRVRSGYYDPPSRSKDQAKAGKVEAWLAKQEQRRVEPEGEGSRRVQAIAVVEALEKAAQVREANRAEAEREGREWH